MEHNHMLPRPRDGNQPGGQQEKLLHHSKQHGLQASLDSHRPSDQNPIHLQSPYPPPSYAQSYDATTLSFPDAPTTELAPIQPHADHAATSNNHLPSLSTLSSLAASQPRSSTPSQPSEPSYSPPPVRSNNWPSLNHLTTYYTPSHVTNADAQNKMDVDAVSSGSNMSTASPDRSHTGARVSKVGVEDPDVLIAAEALGELRADFVSSPPNRPTPLPASLPPSFSTRASEPEPLLSLLTTSHPLIATTIEGATSVYKNSKNLNPTIKNGVEYVEGYLGPIATTFGSVSRATGVDGGVRWFLRGAGRRDRSSTSDLEAGDSGSNKRRKVDGSPREVALDVAATAKPELEMYGFTKDRRTSMSTVDTLPAYDDFRSPAYSETADAQTRVTVMPGSGATAAWSQRLMLSTSGLSIAMREESLRSLKYCLNWLRWANEHIAKIIAALNTALDQYERSADRSGRLDGDAPQDATQGNSTSGSSAAQQDRGEIAARIAALKSDVLKTLRGVIETVSKYAGGALPDNARSLVHRHLTSLPQRFVLATKQESPAAQQGHGEREEDVREGAQRALVLAKEGLDMMAQVSGVLDGTIVSAEEWCEVLRKKKSGETEPTGAVDVPSEHPPPLGVDEDTRMD